MHLGPRLTQASCWKLPEVTGGGDATPPPYDRHAAAAPPGSRQGDTKVDTKAPTRLRRGSDEAPSVGG